jgi:hypothetical protein
MKAISLLLLSSSAIRINQEPAAEAAPEKVAQKLIDPEWAPAMTHVMSWEDSEGKSKAQLAAEAKAATAKKVQSFMLEQTKLQQAYFDRTDAAEELRQNKLKEAQAKWEDEQAVAEEARQQKMQEFSATAEAEQKKRLAEIEVARDAHGAAIVQRRVEDQEAMVAHRADLLRV